MARVLMTLAEDRPATTPERMAVLYRVDEEDCFAFTDALLALGHDVLHACWHDLDGDQFTRIFDARRRAFVDPPPLSSVDLVFVYKMEGFYADPARFDAMLDTFTASGAIVVNDPATIRHNLDKRYLRALEAVGVRTIPTTPLDERARERLSAGERLIVKPIRGERGAGVRRLDHPEDLDGLDAPSLLVQPYIPGIRDGERSLVYLGHTLQHAVIKRPSATDPDEFRCNESLGGTVTPYDPPDDERAFAAGVLRAYEDLGCPVHYSRVDLVRDARGPMLMEAELINPSIYANYVNRGAAFGAAIARYFDGLIASA